MIVFENDEGEAIKVGIHSSDSVSSMKRDLVWEVRNEHPKRIPGLKKFSGLKCARYNNALHSPVNATPNSSRQRRHRL